MRTPLTEKRSTRTTNARTAAIFATTAMGVGTSGRFGPSPSRPRHTSHADAVTSSIDSMKCKATMNGLRSM